MADLTIGQLTKAAEMTDDALLPLEQGGEARVITGALIKRYALDSVQPYAEASESAAGRAEAAAGSAEASAESAQADASDAGVSAASAKEDAAKAAASEAVVQASANAASVSETNAAASAAAASASQIAAAASEANAKASENAAAESQRAAKTSETNAAASETAASHSAGEASSSASAAADSAEKAKASADAAAAHESAAAKSDAGAAASASAASASQAAAKTSETNAKTSESNAKASETAAAASETAAASSASAAAAAETRAEQSESFRSLRAAAAADEAETFSLNAPKIEGGTWHIYDQNAQAYVDTGIAATGPQGVKGDTGAQGATGEKGEKGDPGQDGTSFTIRARYDTLDDLLAAHPTGTLGDAYAVGFTEDNVVYIWSEDGTWTSIGRMQGPKGDKGDTGETGPQGPQGEKGDTGAKGDPGAAGKSAYAAAQEQGFSGTETAFGTALSGLPPHLSDTDLHIFATERNAWNAKCGKAVAFTVTLSTVGWSENTQAVSDSRFLTDGYAYSVTPDSGSFSAYGEAMIYADNVTTAGQMRFHCSEAPTTDLNVNILRMEVSA